VLLSFGVVMLFAKQCSMLRPSTVPQTPDSRKYYCLRVIDGDTIVVKRLGSIRLLGIDCPEMNYEIGDPEPYARDATDLCESLVDGEEVRLEFDEEKRDKYGRVLAYVFVKQQPSGDEVFVNAELVRMGLARVYRYSSNRMYLRQLSSLEKEARSKGLGMWSNRRAR